MRIQQILIVAALGLINIPSAAFAVTLKITVHPENAQIYSVSSSGTKTLLSSDNHAQLKLKKRSGNRILVEAPGYKPRTYEFPKKKYPSKRMSLTLDERIVKVRMVTPQATLKVNQKIINSDEVLIPKGTCVAVEIRKLGFKSELRRYCNTIQDDEPPIEESFALSRAVWVEVDPPSSRILVDGLMVGDAATEVVIPDDGCAVVRVEKEGYEAVEKSYCNGGYSKYLEADDVIVLENRMIEVRAEKSVNIRVQGRTLDEGDSSVRVRRGACVTVEAELAGYITERRQFCNKSNSQPPPLVVDFELSEDEAIDYSKVVDQGVNTTSMIEAGEMLFDDAWQAISSIVLQYFEVLAIMDKSTGYIRSDWVGRRFARSTVRTRIIVMLRDKEPVKFAIKIESQHAEHHFNEPVLLSDDSEFSDWGRLLGTYIGIKAEITNRLVQK